MSTEPRTGDANGHDLDDAPLDLAATAALIDAQRARVESALDVDARFLFATWGAAWLVGFGVLWAATLDEPPLGISPGVAGACFAVLLAAAMVLTTIHLSRQGTGLRGASAVQGAMYGWAWFLSFGVLMALSFSLVRAGADEGVMGITMTVVPALIVGALYMAGGAIWKVRSQFVLGAWIQVVTIAAALVGTPDMLLVMALAGGGGMLAAAVSEDVRRRRSGRPGAGQR